MSGKWVTAVLAVMVMLSAKAASAGVLDEVKERGSLRCAVTRSGIGVAETDQAGRWIGFFPEFCRVIAASVLGDKDAVEFVELEFKDGFLAVRSGQADVFMTNTTWTLKRDAGMGLHFSHTLLYDGQGFMAHRSLAASSAQDLPAASVCVLGNTTTEANLDDFAAKRNPRLKPMKFNALLGVFDAFFSRRCDVLTADRIELVSQRLSRASKPEDYVIIPGLISKEPLGPVVRDDDPRWFSAVRWSTYATIAAEEKGINAANVEAMKASTDPEVRRLLGVDAGMGRELELDDGWALRAIKQVGNYGEIFDRTLGMGSPHKLDRGVNALWTNGGLMIAPPVR
ncbi:MAG: amino acid ABC transporter substrate-binding protein [Rhodospirillales bacterium]|nr:amino acid ABC transporter substrate-binding protein [Rhodospirillales bacterium]